MLPKYISKSVRRPAALAALVVALLLGMVGLGMVRAFAAETPIPPSPTTWVTDTAGVISPATREQLESRLTAYNRSTGHQVIVWIGNTTGDAPLEDWTIRAFTAWKVGRKGLNDGVAVFIFMQDRKVRIEVGYGLEPVITDAVASRIARNEIAARMKSGDVDGAVTAGVSALLAAIGGEQGAPAQQTSSGTSNTAVAVNLIAFGIGIFILLLTFGILLRARRWVHMYPISSGMATGGFFGGWSSGSSWGGGGGGFSGFSGGGGMGGGGGASAGW